MSRSGRAELVLVRPSEVFSERAGHFTTRHSDRHRFCTQDYRSRVSSSFHGHVGTRNPKPCGCSSFAVAQPERSVAVRSEPRAATQANGERAAGARHDHPERFIQPTPRGFSRPWQPWPISHARREGAPRILAASSRWLPFHPAPVAMPRLAVARLSKSQRAVAR